MKLNNKGFMLAEVIITSVTVMVALVALYGTFSKLCIKFEDNNNYDHVDAMYAARGLYEVLINGEQLRTDIININSIISGLNEVPITIEDTSYNYNGTQSYFIVIPNNGNLLYGLTMTITWQGKNFNDIIALYYLLLVDEGGGRIFKINDYKQKHSILGAYLVKYKTDSINELKKITSGSYFKSDNNDYLVSFFKNKEINNTDKMTAYLDYLSNNLDFSNNDYSYILVVELSDKCEMKNIENANAQYHTCYEDNANNYFGYFLIP